MNLAAESLRWSLQHLLQQTCKPRLKPGRRRCSACARNIDLRSRPWLSGGDRVFPLRPDVAVLLSIEYTDRLGASA